jgi:hypothetical protein
MTNFFGTRLSRMGKEKYEFNPREFSIMAVCLGIFCSKQAEKNTLLTFFDQYLKRQKLKLLVTKIQVQPVVK